ncbi:Flp pilus assembly complex ATPase component TadA [Marinobacterium sp. A346]|uniref:Flp pilus assembly complex ATPase component TadA n=1 Tax=Marinobacterium weihaiense TaxID=2851016 RepID=A0ABS6MAG9_9GAMM|nr:ATPase, T2SS/T4P/T4SS family [Marinobacterium weihaiense]MBV0933292.1 Flp pilus assembly complex ATPase component TadA [Marinobacterium weihaiense]
MPISLERSLLRLVSAIKVMSAMDISDHLRPQDGRYSASLDGQQYDIRVSTSVTPHGESMVMRLLPKGISVSGLADLGFAPEHLVLINRMFQQPHGMLLMTGPTGSGKTTALHAGLKPHGMTGKNILTVEDPIEYELPVASQTQVNRKAGYTFDAAIRHFLRHDPDIMLVGEIRDTETAEAAMRAAETGHLVLSTLHVNSVYGVVGRLGALGMPTHSIADTLIGCINQRLVRRICEHCKVPAAPPE